MRWWQRLLHRKQMEKHLQSELQFHLDRQISDYVRVGIGEEEARRKAHLQFGGIEQVKEECREARGTLWVESIISDVRFAFRTLRQSPGFTLTVISTLALGIGANAAIFQLLDAVRLRSLPVARPQELAMVQVEGGNKGFGVDEDFADLTYPLWEQIRQNQKGFSGVFAWASDNFLVGPSSQPQHTPGLYVSGDLFPALGITPLKGHLFTSNDDRPGCGLPGVVISYGMWQSEFGGKDSAIGNKLWISDHPVEVIGVTPPRFSGLEIGRTFNMAVPFCSLPALFPQDDSLVRRDYFWLRVMGRLKPGWSFARASAQLHAISPSLMEATMPTGYQSSILNVYRKFQLAAYPGEKGVSDLRRVYDTSLWLLLGMTGLVLLLACTNLANLMLARASAREREVAVRLALGAGRWRLLHQLLCEGLLLAFSGAVLGGFLASAFSKALVLFLSTHREAVYLDLSIDWRTLVFLAMIAVGTCLLFDLTPMLRTLQTEPGASIRSGSRGMTATRERFTFQRTLITLQITISLALLVGALLFVRSFWSLMRLDPGFRENGIVVASLNFSGLPPVSEERAAFYVQNIVSQLRTLPQVKSAGTSTHVPLDGSSWTLGFTLDSSKDSSKFTWVSSGYFETMGKPLLRGRTFNDRDTPSSPRIAVVNETFVRKFISSGNPLGRTLRTVAEPNYPVTEYEIVGVVKDARYDDLREKIPPEVFGSAQQFNARAELNVFIYSSLPPAAVISAVRQKLKQISPETRPDFHILKAEIQDRLVRERLMALLSGFFGALATLLAAIGLYGVVSYVVLKRRNEIAIRIALGASRYDVIGMIMRQALTLVGVGVTLGIPLSLALGQSARSLLFGMPVHDPITLLGAVGFLVMVTVLATFLPAWRVARLSPMTALRNE